MTLTRRIQAGATDQSVVLRIIDATDGTPETGVVYDTAGIDLKYWRPGAAVTSIAEAELATPAIDDGHADGGFIHLGSAYYRLDLPDAAVAAGVPFVLVFGDVTGMVVIGCLVELVGYDPSDSVRLGLTALPNAAPDAAGGLPVSDAGGLDLDALDSKLDTIIGYVDTEIATILSNLGAVLTDTGTTLDGKLDALATAAGAIQTVTDNLPDAGALTTITNRLPASLSGGRMRSDAEAVSGSTDAADALERGALLLISGACQTGTLTTTVFDTDLSGYDADRLIGRPIYFTSAPLAGEVGVISDYDGAGQITVEEALTEAPADGTTFDIV